MEEDLSTLTESRLSYLTLWPYHQGGISKVTVAQLDQIFFEVAKEKTNEHLIIAKIREFKATFLLFCVFIPLGFSTRNLVS